jgi:hypothetical protein
LRDGSTVALYPSPLLLLKPEICIYHEGILDTRAMIKTVTSVSREVLKEIAPEYLKICEVSLGN